MDLLLTTLLKTTAILAGAYLATALLKRQSASLRSLLWLLALSASLILPALSQLVPVWRVVPAGGSFLIDATRNGSSAHFASYYSPMQMLALLWAMGAAMMAGRTGIAYARVRNVVHRATPVTALGHRVMESSETETPITCGLLKPQIVLPGTWRTWTPDGLQFVLTHESAHISRFDNTRQFIGHLARTLYWFHPLVWLACSRMKRECEQACDDAVLGAGARPSDYASYIVRIAAENPLTSAAALAIAEPSSLELRVRGILDGSRDRQQIGRRMILGMLAAAAICLLPLAAAGADEPVYRIGEGGVTAPKKVYTPEPQYSNRARDEKVEGTVLLSVVITSKGAVDDIQVERGIHPDLDAAAISTLTTWKFEPATKDAKPVAVAAHIEVNFRLVN
jgi:TonB family protein